MREIAFREFRNNHGDTVKLQLSADSFGGFHLVAKMDRLRRTQEKRVVNGALVEIPKSTITHETSHARFTTEYSGLTEFNLERVLNRDPLFSSADFAEWQKATKEEGN